ncbi:unnamed protein product, partial [Brassica oleracea var. botrytis]
MPSQPNHLEEILCRGHRSPIVEVRLLRFWEARTFKRGGELMGWICFSLCQGFPIFDNFTFSFLKVGASEDIYIATTSTKDYRDSNISGREAMQSSDDITINSTASVKRRGRLVFPLFLSLNQKKLRADLYNNVYDAVETGDADATQVGKKIILPSSFTAGPRYMSEKYQDAMAICRWYENPHLFITVSANPNWVELGNHLDAYG